MARPHNDFLKSAKLVYQLMEFDHIIQDHLLAILKPIYEAQQKVKHLAPVHSVDGAYRSLKSIRDHDSLRPRYEDMYNQCLVLLVSHFTSATRALFTASVAEALITRNLPASLRIEKLNLTVEQTLDLASDPEAWLSELLITRDKLTFQDMQSTLRAFKDFCGASVSRDGSMNDIIAGQAFRHVIVHNAGIVDGKCLAQLRDVSPRTIKPTPVVDERVRFAPYEIRSIGDSMIRFLRRLTNSAYRQAHSGGALPVDNRPPRQNS